MSIDRSNLDRLMDRAARVAARGHGLVEPGCMVGAVVAGADGTVLAEDRYRRYGGPHAERAALEKAGDAARGGTLLVTLEPCDHHGKTPPCTEAVVASGVSTVVHACHDPNELAAGGTEALRRAGIEVIHHPTTLTESLNAPHRHRTRTGLPWMIAKWAQTLDGRIATGNGRSKWISSTRSRRLVHRERGRVDAILTGVGTVLADDPLLTPRDLRRARRTPERVVVDDQLDTPLDAGLVTTAGDTPTTILCSPEAVTSARAGEFRAAGVRVAGIDEASGLRGTLRAAAAERGWSTMMIEAGGGLLGRLFRDGLVNRALVFSAPLLVGDESAPGPVRGLAPDSIESSIHLERLWSVERDPDRIEFFRVAGGD